MSRFSLVILLSLVVASANQWWWEYEELPQPVFNMVDNLVTYANGLPLDHKNESVRALFEALKVVSKIMRLIAENPSAYVCFGIQCMQMNN
ncbi:hypothetical protein RB195_003436 [Necator americanus]|uniref:Uncharacterized protein n=1 Tax=Necator americanus TaxID=51031 RepID=A0ABR1DNJ6_NECAM